MDPAADFGAEMREIARRAWDSAQMIRRWNRLEALQMLAKTLMRPFEREDWCAFAGCESADPWIGFHGTDILILDGTNLVILSDDESELHVMLQLPPVMSCSG